MIREPPLSNRKSLYKWTITVLERYSIKPIKRYSQNFVVDPMLVKSILNEVSTSESLVEVGTGVGTLSYYLSRRVRGLKVFYEVDLRLIEVARQLVDEGVLINSDALKHDWVFKQVVSTVPYHLTSDILVKIARSNYVEKGVLVLQREVVDRITAKPGSSNYGRLTILMNTVFRQELGGVYPPRSFYPEPDVYSRLIVLNRVRSYDKVVETLEEVTKRVFNERRRKSVNVFRSKLGLNNDDLRRLSIDPDKRVYELSTGDFIRIAEYVTGRF